MEAALQGDRAAATHSVTPGIAAAPGGFQPGDSLSACRGSHPVKNACWPSAVGLAISTLKDD